MGGCVSKPGRSLRNKFRNRRKPNKRSLYARSSHTNHPTLNNATSVGEAWFDSVANLESDCSDEDFHSFPDDVLSINGSEGASGSNSSSIRYSKDSVHSHDGGSLSKSYGPLNEAEPVFPDEIGSNIDESDNIPSNNCLPCLAYTVPTIEKRRSLSSSPSNSRNKASHKRSFKWREGHPNSNLISSKALLQRPIAGSQVPFSPLEKEILDSWSHIDPNTFKVRGENYLKDKKKEPAPSYAAYYAFGVDVFLSNSKVDHIARFVDLPVVSSCVELPPILVVNVQIPLYPATLFQSETNGEGMNIVLYFKLSENYTKEIPSHFQESIRRLIVDDLEKIKGFTMDKVIPFRERLKILGRVVNVDDLQLGAAERKLMRSYNEKPLLSRPQHEFYSGENYFEIDLDMHRFSYISRKGFETFQDRLKLCILDFGLTIQGNKAEELPEQILCCIRLNGLNYMNYQQLGLSQDPQ